MVDKRKSGPLYVKGKKVKLPNNCPARYKIESCLECPYKDCVVNE